MFEQLSLAANVALLVVAAAVVWRAGSRLARLADALARRTGLGHALLGLLLLGGITSLPEAAVAVTATLDGAPLLTINDVLGSAAINLLILAVADALYGRGALTSTPGRPGVLLQGCLSAALFTLVAVAVTVPSPLVLGVGVGSWVLLGGAVGGLALVSRSGGHPSWVPDPQGVIVRGALSQESPHLGTPALLRGIALSALAIMAAGVVLARTAGAIAQDTGLGHSFVGAVLLVLCTSLPEVSTVVAAVRLRQYEMAIADIFGTNLFNVSLLVLVDALHPGPAVLNVAGPFAVVAALLGALMTLLFLAGMLERRDRTVARMGFDSLGVTMVYAGGLALMYSLRGGSR